MYNTSKLTGLNLSFLISLNLSFLTSFLSAKTISEAVEELTFGTGFLEQFSIEADIEELLTFVTVDARQQSAFTSGHN